MRAERGAAAWERVRVGRRSVWSGLTLTLTVTLTLATAPWRSAPWSSASTSPSPSRPGSSARHDGFRRRRRRCDMELPARLGVLSLSLCIPPCLHMSCLVHTIQVTDTYDPLTHLNHFTGTTVEPSIVLRNLAHGVPAGWSNLRIFFYCDNRGLLSIFRQ